MVAGYPAPLDRCSNAGRLHHQRSICRGITDRIAVEWVIELRWNRWSICHGIRDRNGVEYATRTTTWDTTGVVVMRGCVSLSRFDTLEMLWELRTGPYPWLQTHICSRESCRWGSRGTAKLWGRCRMSGRHALPTVGQPLRGWSSHPA